MYLGAENKGKEGVGASEMPLWLSWQSIRLVSERSVVRVRQGASLYFYKKKI